MLRVAALRLPDGETPSGCPLSAYVPLGVSNHWTVPHEVSRRQLDAALKRMTEAHVRLGRAAQWTPQDDSAAGRVWQAAASDPLARTVTEADAHACALTQSALEHARIVGDGISNCSPSLPHSVGRTALEHASRAHHQLDDQADDLERASRRLNKWGYAIEQGTYLRSGIVRAGHPGARTMPDLSEQLALVEARANGLGLAITKTRKGQGFVRAGRPGTMELAETYLSGDGGAGVPAFLFRRHSAFAHGLETGLLGQASKNAGPGGVNVLTAQPAPVPEAAFGLMGVPLALGNAQVRWRAVSGGRPSGSTRSLEPSRTARWRSGGTQ